ncbi:hypothetical protein Tco_0278247 [Tanacetum coccineum]
MECLVTRLDMVLEFWKFMAMVVVCGGSMVVKWWCKGIRNVPPNGVFGNEVYGSDSEGFGMNPSSNEFRLCNSDEWRSGNHGGRVIIHGYGGGGDMVVRQGLKGCLDHRIIRSSPILPPLQRL